MDTKGKITVFLALLKELQKIDNGFPLQYAICFAEIAQSEGISLSILSDKTKMPLSTVSRIIGALSQNRQKGKPYQLVYTVISSEERRKKEVYLTSRGRDVMQNIQKILQSDTQKRLHG